MFVATFLALFRRTLGFTFVEEEVREVFVITPFLFVFQGLVELPLTLYFLLNAVSLVVPFLNCSILSLALVLR